MRVFEKITNKSYWISTFVIVFGILLFQSTVSNLILKYIPLSGLVLTIVTITIIVFLTRIISEEILEV